MTQRTETLADRTWDDAAVERLRASLDGELITPEADAYEQARRVWNGLVDRYPALIVRAATAADVAQAVGFARAHRLPLAVRSGGHSMAGHGTVDHGLVLDLAGMKALRIDPERRLARAEPGLTWGEYAQQADAYGLATTSGDMGTVGIGGLALGGGIGWFVRRYGLTIDNLQAVELVTADGRLVRASAEEHPDLFWAVRGGGGNFGVATAFEFRLHPAGTILGGAVFYPLERLHEVLSAYVRLAVAAPDELTSMAMIMPAPAAPFMPAEVQGTPVLAIMACYAGDLAAGERVLAPLRALDTPIVDVIGPMPYPGMFALTAEAAPAGILHEIRSTYLRALDDELLATIVAHSRAMTVPAGGVQLRVLGGAMARVPAEATAFAHRDKPFLLSVIGAWVDPAETARHQSWVQGFWRALRPHAAGVYVNFLEDEGDGRVRDAYPPATYERLAVIKRRYDPDNLFRLNQNIRPWV